MQTCFLVCNAHLDPVWLWTWEEGLSEAISTFRIAADFCEEHPEFVFVHNEALLYEWVERNAPEVFARIRKLVKAGRWKISGGAWLQPDLTAPSGEAVVRQYLFGLRYFREKFGVRPRTAYNFDTFGHPQGMIRILNGCGFTQYVFCRPGPRQKPLPVGSFRWQLPEGGEIVARRSDDHYITQGQLRNSMRNGNWPAHYRNEGDFMFLWGLGNHGGGASREEYAQLPEMRADFPEVRFVESDPDTFFEHSRHSRDFSKLPVVRGDLHEVHHGCYTSMIRVKQRYFELENRANATERIALLAWAAGRRDYPAADFRSAWKDILFTAFHDILPGSGIPDVERDSLAALDRAEEIFRRKRAEILISLLRDQPRAAEGITSFFVFNPHGRELDTLVEFEYGTARQWGTDGMVRTLFCDGRPLPAQFEKGQLNLDDPGWGEWRRSAVFRLQLPPLGFKRIDASYTTIPCEQIRRKPLPAMPDPAKIEICGDGFAVTVSRRTGLAQIVYGGKTVLAAGSFRPELFLDQPHSWETPAGKWRKSPLRFRLMTPAEATGYLNSEAVNPGRKTLRRAVQLIEDGPFRATVEAHFIAGRSTLTLRYKIEKTRPRLTVELDSDLRELDTMLKIALRGSGKPAALETEKCYSIDAEPLDGPRERTWQGFIRLTPENGASWGLLGAGTHGYHIAGNTLFPSVLRTPAYGCMHIPPENVTFLGRRTEHQDIGPRRVKFGVVFGPDADAHRLAFAAREFAMPAEGFVYFPTAAADASPVPLPVVAVESESVELAALKQSEDGSAVIARFRECANRPAAGVFRFAGKSYPLTLGPGELQTLRIDADGNAVSTDLIEDELPGNGK